MSNRIWVSLFFVLVFVGSIPAAEIQTFPVFDFRGGMVNNLSSGVTQQNQSWKLENFDFDPWGGLRRRKGVSLFTPANKMRTSAFVPHAVLGSKAILLLRVDTLWVTRDSIRLFLDVIDKCNGVTCTTTVHTGLYQRSAFNTLPYNINQAVWNGKTIIAAANSEPVIFDGNAARRLRPLIPGQPDVFVRDSVGVLDGVYTYKLAYIYAGGDTVNDTSLFGAPSFPVEVRKGMAVIKVNGPFRNIHDFALIYRKQNDSGNYAYVGRIATSGTTPSYFIDNTTSVGTEADSPADPLTPGELSLTDLARLNTVGAVVCTLANATKPGIFAGISDTCQDDATLRALYTVAYIDSAGRFSYLLPGRGDEWDVDDIGSKFDSVKAHLHIPAATDSYIKHRLLLRSYLVSAQPRCVVDTTKFHRWYIVDTLTAAETSYVDSATATAIHVDARLWRTEYMPDTLPMGVSNTGRGYGVPEEFGDDSIIAFRPRDLVVHGSRFFAIGYPYNANALYYSEFGYPTKWPSDKFINIASPQGDWFVRLLSLEDRLLLFRQNSIVQITGLRFYNFNVSEATRGIGIVAPRSLAYSGNDVFFAHQTGIYQYARGGGLIVPAITTPIKRSMDSLTLRLGWGAVVKDEYWFGAGGKTYIYSQTPSPTWRVYSLRLKDAVIFDADTLVKDFRTDRYLLLTTGDTVYSYGAGDTTDAGTRIVASYRSPFFFEGADREKICYLDLFGDGNADSVTVTIFTDTTVSVKSVTFKPNFNNRGRDRVILDQICERASIQITDNGKGQYAIRGYIIGWLPWDKGKL